MVSPLPQVQSWDRTHRAFNITIEQRNVNRNAPLPMIYTAQIAPQLTARCLKRHQRNLTIPFSKNSFIAIGNARTPARCACNSRACMLRLYLREHNAYWCLSHAAVIYRLGDYRCQVFRVGRPASVHNAYMYYSSPACSRNGRSQKFQNEMK